VVALFQRYRGGFEWFDERNTCVVEVSLYFQFELNTLVFLVSPTVKSLRDRGQHIVGLYLENCLRETYIDMNAFPYFGVENSPLNFVRTFYTYHVYY